MSNKNGLKVFRPEIHELVQREDPPTLQGISDAVDGAGTVENVRRYLHRHNLHKTWMRNRRNRARRKELVGQIAQMALVNAAGNEDPYLRRVIERGAHRGIRLDGSLDTARRTANVLRAYEKALARGKKLSLSKIGRMAGNVNYQIVETALKRMGIEVERVKRKRATNSNNVKRAIKDNLGLDMMDVDICYFLQLPNYALGPYRNGKNSDKVKHPNISTRKDNLKLASQIYEAKDLGFNSDEISELLNIEEWDVKKYIGQRRELSPIISGALRRIYPDRRQDVPYLTLEDRLE